MLLFSLLIPVFLVGHGVGYREAIRDVDRFNGECSVMQVNRATSPVDVYQLGSLIWGCLLSKIDNTKVKGD